MSRRLLPKFVSLTDFIEQFDWEYSDLDIVDRREIKHLAAENFWPYIAKSEVPLEEPGHLSAVTVAKGIEYGVNLLGCFIEGYVGSNQALSEEAEAHFGKMTQAALEFARGSFATCFEEHNWYEHFELLMRHPVINAGVQIAAWHHYRLPEQCGMADYQLRLWNAWHHHMALVMMAMLFMLSEKLGMQEQCPLLSCADIERLLAAFLPRRDASPEQVLSHMNRRHEMRRRAIASHAKRNAERRFKIT